MAVGDYVRKPVHTAAPHETLRTVAQRMAQTGVGCLVVTDEERVTGVVTDRDVAIHVLREGLDADTALVSHVLRRQPVTVHVDSQLAVAAALMRRHALRRLPVVDREERLIGIITSDDLFRLVARELGGLADAIECQDPGAGSGAPTPEASEISPEVE